MLACLVLLVALVNSGATSPGVEVDDLTGKQFEAALETEDNLAVYWCKYFKALPSFFTITPLYLNMDYCKGNHPSSPIVEVFLVSAVHSYHPSLSPNREVPRIDNFPVPSSQAGLRADGAGESALPAEELPSAGTGRARTLRILQENSIDFITGAGEENHSTCRGLNPLTPT